MIGSTQNLGKLGYGALYIVPATFMYLFSTDATLPLTFLGEHNYNLASLLLLLLSLYAAIWLHRAGLLIFGDDAGLMSTRTERVINKNTVYFATGVWLSEPRDTTSIISAFSNAVKSEDMNWGVFL